MFAVKAILSAVVASSCASAMQLTMWSGQPSVALENAAVPGTMMPVVGLGTGGYRHGAGNPRIEEWNDTTAVMPTQQWIKAGGRRIDTADTYGDEGGIGKGVMDAGIPRDQLFITSKTGPGMALGYNETLSQVDWLLGRLQTSYVDLLLVHWPYPGSINNSTDPACASATLNPKLCRQSTWRALEAAFHAGKARAIGVSNYEQHHLEDILELNSLIPAVNQVEYHPYWHEDDLVAFCQQHNIQFNGYAPLAAVDLEKLLPGVLDEPAVTAIAKRLDVSAAQVVLRWEIQQGLVINPRSMDPAHMAENLDIFQFTLTDADMAAITAIPAPVNTTGKICPDPHTMP